MKRYHLEVITGFGPNNGNVGLHSFTVEADNFDYEKQGMYRFFNYVNREGFSGWDIVAMYPVNRTIIKKIEEI